MNHEKQIDNEDGPYGRDKIPTLVKPPSYFSLLKPFKILIWAWFWCMHTTFKGWWTGSWEQMKSSYDAEFGMFLMGVLGIIVFGMTQALPIGLILGLGFGITGWWIFATQLGFYFIHALIFFAFHLHTEEGLQHWKDKLLS